MVPIHLPDTEKSFPLPSRLTLGSIRLGGDDPETENWEGWDPLFSRWPKWSFSYLYTLIQEHDGRVAYWSNFASLYAALTFNIKNRIDLIVTIHHLTAPELSNGTAPYLNRTGKNRGTLFVTKTWNEKNQVFRGFFLRRPIMYQNQQTFFRRIPLLLMITMMISCNQSQKIINEPEFVKAEEEWRAERDRQMQSPTSWLTIAGLLWLEEGENTFGTDANNPVRFPEGSAPPIAGTFILKNDQTQVVSSSAAELKHEDKVIQEMVLKSDADGRADLISLNDLRFWVIKRGDRYAIRLRDLNAPRFKVYNGLHFFPINHNFKLKGEFVPYTPPKTVEVATVIGTTNIMTSPGYVKFEIDGNEYRLDGFGTPPQSESLFFVFKDGTSGEETYGASRFMGAQVSEDGSVDMNFNRAYNPPCAYTPYATCPLPPPQNVLDVRIEAGEKNYGTGH